jgi:hypothetical protein
MSFPTWKPQNLPDLITLVNIKIGIQLWSQIRMEIEYLRPQFIENSSIGLSFRVKTFIENSSIGLSFLT